MTRVGYTLQIVVIPTLIVGNSSPSSVGYTLQILAFRDFKSGKVFVECEHHEISILT